MKRYIRKASATLFATAITVAGCGGGGSSGGDPVVIPPPEPPPIGGIEGTGLAVGVISGFGSVIVNGVRYDTSDATITVDDSPGNESDLAVGQVIVLRGSIDDNGTTGTADTIDFDAEVEGPIASIAADGQSFAVLGQSVSADADTVYDDSLVLPLQVGDEVEISGFRQSDGTILATRIEPQSPGSELEVKGTVGNLDAASLVFDLGTLTVDYSSATLEDFPGAEIREGDPVEVHGTSFNAQNQLEATRVEFEDESLGGEDGEHAEIEGLVTRFVSSADFDVSGQAVVTNASTEFEGGTAADLGLDVKVEVEGDFDASLVLVADKVEIKTASNVRIETTVDDVDAEAGTVTVFGGLLIKTGSGTQFEDSSDIDLERFSVSDINIGDFLEIRGAENPANSGEVLASRLERNDPDPDSRMRGIVASVSRPGIVVLGVDIDTSGAQFRDENEQSMTADQFFDRLNAGDAIQVDGTWNGSMLVADEVEFESDN
jgi:cytoskeletal protein CcmA (bactofilin family)